MKIYLGPAGIPTTCAGDTVEGIKTLAKLGLNAMEIQFTYGVYMDVANAKKVGLAAKENNVRLSIHAPYYINLCQKDKVKLARSKKNVIDAAKIAESIGAKVIVFHPGAYMGMPKEEAFERALTACEELSKQVSVKLGLEVTGKQGQFGNFEEVLNLSKKVKGCVPVVDFAHVYARNAGSIDYPFIFSELKKLNLEFYHFHFSGIHFTKKAEGVGNESHHEPISVNKPPFEPLAREIMKTDKDVTIISESPILEQDSIIMKRVFQVLGHNF